LKGNRIILRFFNTALIAFLLVIFGVLPNEGIPTDQGLLTNGSFEIFDNGFTGWTIFTGSWAQDNIISIQGNSSKLTTVDPGMTSIAGISQTVSTTVGQHYYFAAWIYITAGAGCHGRISVQFGNEATQYNYTTTNNGWERLSYDEVAPTGTSSVKFGIDVYSDNEGVIHYADEAVMGDEPLYEFSVNTFVVPIIGIFIGVYTICYRKEVHNL
jgi:hypothetical protein